ncbi:2-succinyl-5-enolpyruvyl-6-hydroxy-3-cyclohexene-1-carboxylic-acid synthase [Micropruina sonneratiae]|uniref:2-succinyl-5-enolpyruvyl-6-hydroxy-3- cyclohexene-1-carboxylic-acid synthase n=1 Tax=Micropruina sonneratiae TaxID=2986940 RepID=UPI0022272D5D|nr:2-succinyl-5-enolpyruvyl-6-hydroxy-3-cyclohexene-1-carboxylic-acid synthase [Micropruina sp. KQZ13P-5]MCW3158083.1 2-succinyl-5-enolpyruvyl-6-hydroxy-3-cyclohexene-1-carboxylic-acid synthase [Micropruina sp. KQZ13P-5]
MTSPRCATAIIAQLVAQGVREVALAPGSRSAPLALALARAELDGLLRLHVRYDERSAGFLALGLAKASGLPVPVVTTSGSAVGNLLPAVMEAHHGGVPLVVVSADRPAAMVGFGANQTTDQVGLFGAFVRWAARVSSTAPAASWPAQVARACLLAADPAAPGPVHLNVELAEPLVGDEEPFPRVRPVMRADSGRAEPVALGAGPRTLLLCGDAAPDVGRRVAALADRAGLPLVAEPSSNARAAALRTGRLLLAGPLAGEVERVVVFGHPTLSRPVNRLLASDDVEIVVVAPGGGWVDPGWRASSVVPWVEVAEGDPDWWARWSAADAALSAAVDELVAAQPVLTGPAVAAAVADAVAGGVLVLGSSQPIRDADLAPLSRQRVFANRGLAGIDGTVSTAVGVALAMDEPTTLLCGDLTFLHDLNGLAAGLGERRPDLRIVVADDSGGSIFATLEYGADRYADVFERVFATPSGVDPALVTVGYGVPADRVGTLEELAAALVRPISGVEVIVASVDRAGRRALDRQLNAIGG